LRPCDDFAEVRVDVERNHVCLVSDSFRL